jgi:tRNA (adenine57-N1/adenine58-N1)-methyltransferase
MDDDVKLFVETLKVDTVIKTSVYKSLKPGGFFVSFSPTINQIEKLVESMEAHRGFLVLAVLESFTRSYKVKKGETRPETTMIAHTGYLLFARRLSSRS